MSNKRRKPTDNKKEKLQLIIVIINLIIALITLIKSIIQ